MIIKQLYRNLSFIFILIAMVTVGAIYQFSLLPISLYPATSKPTIRAWLNPKGVDQQEFISDWGLRIEETLLNLDGVTKVTGDYYPSSFGYRIEFDWNHDSNEALAEVRSSLGVFNSRMPRHWGNFWINEGQGNSGRILMMAHSSEMPPQKVGTLLHKKLVPQLQRVEGLENAFVTLRDETEVIVQLDLERLYQYKISPYDVRSAISQRQFDKKLGIMRFKDGSSYEITGALKIGDIEALRQTIIQTRGAQTIRLKDLATVSEEQREEDEVNHANGHRSLFLMAYPKPDANLKNTADGVQEVVQRFLKAHPNIIIDTVASPSKFINRAVRNVTIAVISAMTIASFIVFLFFGSFRNSIIISLSMPLSLCMTLIIMQVFGVGINLLSLGGMAIAVGMVVDSTIVTLENIVRRMNEQQPVSFDQRLNVIYLAVKEVANSVIASALTTVIVFFPMIFTAPLAAAVLGDLAIVMVCVITMSLLVSFFIIPSLYLWTSQNKKETSRPIFSRIFMSGFDAIENIYIRSLKLIFRRPTIILSLFIVILGLLGGSVFLFTDVIPREIMPTPKTDMMILGIEMKNRGNKVEDVESIIYDYEQAMIHEFAGVFSGIYAGIDNHDVWIAGHLKDLDKYDAVKQLMEERFTNQFDFSVNISSWAPSKLEIPSPPDLRIYISKENPDEAREELRKLQESLNQNSKLTNIRTRPGIWKHNRFVLNFEEEQIRRISATNGNQLDINFIQDLVQYAVEKQFLQPIRINGEEHQLYMQYNPEKFVSLQDLSNIMLPLGKQVIPLRSLVDLNLESQWGHYKNEDSKQVYYIEANIKEIHKGDKAAIIAKLKQQLVTDGIEIESISFYDPTTEVDENINSLLTAIMISLALILMVITVQFGNLKLSLIAMTAIPLGFIGVAFSLFLFDEKLSINSMLGLILLCGTAVNNSIIFIDFFVRNYQNRGEKTLDEVLINTARLRFKPIMMTTLTTIIGMLPIAFGFGSGGEILRSLGVTVSGGLGVSTFLTLIFIPLGLRITTLVQTREKKPTMARLQPKILWVIIGLLSASFLDTPLARANSWSLRDVETRALQLSPQSQLALWNMKQSEMLKQETIASSLPSLNYLYRKKRIGTSPIREGELGNLHSISITQRLANPYREYQKLNGVEHLKASYSKEYQHNLIEIKSDIWLKYFDVIYQQKRLQSMQELLNQFTPRYKEQEQRFNNGLINIDDLQRFRIQWEAVSYQVSQRKTFYQAAKLRLATLLAAKVDDLDLLQQDFPESFDLQDIFKTQIDPLLKNPKSLQREALEHEIAYKKSVANDAKYDYLPNLDLRYESNFLNGTRENNIVLEANWSIFSGFQDRNAEIRKQWDLKNSSLQLQQQSQDWKLALIELWATLADLEAHRQQLKAETQSYRKLLHSSQVRYNAGQISAMDLYNDMEDLITSVNAYWEANFAIVSNLAYLAKHIDKEEVFYTMMEIRS